MWFEFTGFCPKFNEERSIRIKYDEYLPNEFKKLEDDCAYKFDCEHVDRFDRCPISVTAPENPHSA